MRRGRIAISPELLCEILHLPSGTRVVFVEYDSLSYGGPVEVILTIENESLKDVSELGEPPLLRPTFRSVPATAVEFMDWGEP